MSEPNMRGFERAQREWENRLPPEDGPWECAECHGKGEIVTEDDSSECTECGGFGFIGADGKPFDPGKAERDKCDYADWKRDECAW